MEIEVYDTYATSEKGEASNYAQDFINIIAESTDSVILDS